MSIVIVTGSSGLVGSETVRFYCSMGYDVIGIDNNMRKEFFGEDSCTEWNRALLEREFKNFSHMDLDIRDMEGIEKLFKRYSKDISLIVHAAAQPSHDWAAKDPFTDFSVNASATLNLLEAFRRHCPDKVFIFTSTNKVYGDAPNRLPLVELKTRFDLPRSHPWYGGVDETMSVDQSMHSLFGASKLAADVLVQEYGRYFGLRTASFRGGCLTGPAHSGTMLHGFLSYLVRCAITGRRYTIYGYKGKQVRDNIHSKDLVRAFHFFFEDPDMGEVYNMGGGRFSNISMLEAIELTEKVTGRRLDCEYVETPRAGDHIWWISSTEKFSRRYPEWRQHHDCETIIREIYEVQKGAIRSLA